MYFLKTILYSCTGHRKRWLQSVSNSASFQNIEQYKKNFHYVQKSSSNITSIEKKVEKKFCTDPKNMRQLLDTSC